MVPACFGFIFVYTQLNPISICSDYPPRIYTSNYFSVLLTAISSKESCNRVLQGGSALKESEVDVPAAKFFSGLPSFVTKTKEIFQARCMGAPVFHKYAAFFFLDSILKFMCVQPYLQLQ